MSQYGELYHIFPNTEFFLKLILYIYRVKFWTIILAFFLLGLITKPCVDGTLPNSHSNTELSENKDSHTHAADLCSPFCSCACCGVQMVHQPIFVSIDLKRAEDNFEKPSILYRSTLHSSYFGSIWQPPQLA